MTEFSVTQFFEDGSYETERTNVKAREAFETFLRYAQSVGAQMGTTVRVIITDGGDCIVAEWQYGQGIIYPPKKESTNG